jgi:hypothetical protein
MSCPTKMRLPNQTQSLHCSFADSQLKPLPHSPAISACRCPALRVPSKVFCGRSLSKRPGKLRILLIIASLYSLSCRQIARHSSELLSLPCQKESHNLTPASEGHHSYLETLPNTSIPRRTSRRHGHEICETGDTSGRVAQPHRDNQR